ncbi:hypothetical protein FNT36_06150 [Hymenobacter setariae]|uniref:DUF1624 domain-containing protein n=1 Tax=Hymenobacter setariae TaxID=2594794 RepID=A0A558C4E1_9BACT|nr:OpgC domain-containing protein [Hymenobacter setariae]TVT43663.1 hypothetical protein FNT36_06150 [Hymenobacter setariae]
MKRTPQLDFFRGLLLLLITVDHALLLNNIVRRFTYEFVGWVSAAEGFVFLSGLTAGIVYTHKANEKGTQVLPGLALKRARTIYRNHIVLLLFVCASILGSSLLREYWLTSYAPLAKQPILAFIMGSLLVYQPPFLDILPMYAILILLVPFVITWFQRGYIWQVLLGSLALYLVSSLNELFNLFTLPFHGHQLNTKYFSLPSWQILFILGLFIGFLFYKGKTQKWQVNKSLFYTALTISTAIFILKNIHAELPFINIEYATDKSNLGPLRLFNFITICYVVIYISFKRAHWFTYKPICYLGKYSLEVFSFHVFLLILLLPIKMQFNTLYSVQLNQHFFFYPLGTLFVFLGILPLLFLAPTLLGKTRRPAPPILHEPPVVQ